MSDAPTKFSDIERSIIENNMVAPGNKIDDTVYIKRIEICISCECLSEVTCLECGCFVQLRAMQKNKSCPCKEGDKWTDTYIG